MMKRKSELFSMQKLLHDTVISNPPEKMFAQERDWTCSIACIRTIISQLTDDIPSEEAFIKKYKMEPGAFYSKDIKRLGLLRYYDAKFGCDCEKVTFDDVLGLMDRGYFVMLESLYNYSHWFVLLGYYPVSDGNIESSRLLLYDPYYDKVRLENTDEFISMWVDGDFARTKVKNDFIAVKNIF